jgi:hypothetical protein
MSLWSWLKSLRRAPTQPEAAYVVSFDGVTIGVLDPDGALHEMAAEDLRGVVVETDDSGPWGADLWWLLFGTDDRVAVAFPGSSTNEQPVIDWLMKLPGFDFEEMTKAMGSTDVAVFFLWRAAAVDSTSPIASD